MESNRKFPLHLLPALPPMRESYDADSRWYTDETTGKKYRSVTSTIGKALDKSGLQTWRENVGDEEADRVSGRALTRGRIMHDLCEAHVLGREINLGTVMPVNVPTFKILRKALDEHLLRVYGTEVLLRSDELGTAGRTDLIGDWVDEPSIIDYKNVSKWKKEDHLLGYFLQTTTYAMMVKELYDLDIHQIVLIIAVDFETEPQIVVRDISDYAPLVRKIFIDGVPDGSIGE